MTWTRILMVNISMFDGSNAELLCPQWHSSSPIPRSPKTPQFHGQKDVITTYITLVVTMVSFGAVFQIFTLGGLQKKHVAHQWEFQDPKMEVR